MRRKPNLDSRLEKCSLLLVAKPEENRGLWLKKHAFKDLHIELGCGRGLFTTESAKTQPDVLFVALEKTANVLVIAMERAGQEQLNNLFFINKLADDLVLFFTSGEVSRIYINFCDPWPSRRHEKRRLTGQRFLDIYKQLLKAGGEIHFKTDNPALFEFSLAEFERSGFILSELSYDLHKCKPVGIMTDYEMRFHENGVPILRCVAAKDK